MNLIEALQQYVCLTHPDARTDLAQPLRPDGVWSLEIGLAGRTLVIDWSQKSGFGVSDIKAETFGEGPDEIYQAVEDVQKRVDRLLTTPERTSPAMPVLFSRLREQRGLTQQQLAGRLGLKQATISGIERRDDIQLSTLRRVVEALGGELEVFGSFPDARYRIVGTSLRASSECSGFVGVPGRALPNNSTFESLRRSGLLTGALMMQTTISARHAITEMP